MNQCDGVSVSGQRISPNLTLGLMERREREGRERERWVINGCSAMGQAQMMSACLGGERVTYKGTEEYDNAMTSTGIS